MISGAVASLGRGPGALVRASSSESDDTTITSGCACLLGLQRVSMAKLSVCRREQKLTQSWASEAHFRWYQQLCRRRGAHLTGR